MNESHDGKSKKIVERGLEGNDAPKGPKEARDHHS